MFQLLSPEGVNGYVFLNHIIAFL